MHLSYLGINKFATNNTHAKLSIFGQIFPYKNGGELIFYRMIPITFVLLENLEARRKLQKWDKYIFSYLAKNRISSKFSTMKHRSEQGCMEFWTRQEMHVISWTKNN